MAKYDTPDIRNIALIGHLGCGKTSLAERLLFKTKATQRLGRTQDGTSILDFEPDERERKNSINTAVAHASWKGTELNLLDTPGAYPDFVGDAIAGMVAADCAIVCVDASAGVKVGTRKLWQFAKERGLARLVCVTRLDGEHADFDAVLQQIHAALGERCIPFTLPLGKGAELEGVEPVFTLGDASSDRARAANEKLIEAAVETDDALTTRYLEGETISKDELRAAARKAVATGTLFPILCTSAEKDLGIDELLDAVAELAPAPGDAPRPARGADQPADAPPSQKVGPDGPFAAQVFKTLLTEYGRLSLLRVVSGKLEAGSTVTNLRVGKTEKVGHIFRLLGKEKQEVPSAVAGDIVALPKAESLQTSDTLVDAARKIAFPAIVFPQPMVSLAIAPKTQGDETKISVALTRLADEDSTFQIRRDRQTGEQVVTGMSQLHVEITLARMKTRSGVEVTSWTPKIPYLETITAKSGCKYRHKKQTGGAGQFAEVWIRLQPTERGKGFVFSDEIVGMSISRSFIPSIEKGIRAILDKGVIAGCPVVDVEVVLYDGKEHPVDSKDIAFQIAGREAFKFAFLGETRVSRRDLPPSCELTGDPKPVLLEPIVIAEIVVPGDFMGDIMSDLNTRRGRISGTETDGDYQIIRANVPLAEMVTYSQQLRSITQGEGTYSIAHSHHEVVPPQIAQEIIARHLRDKKEEQESK